MTVIKRVTLTTRRDPFHLPLALPRRHNMSSESRWSSTAGSRWMGGWWRHGSASTSGRDRRTVRSVVYIDCRCTRVRNTQQCRTLQKQYETNANERLQATRCLLARSFVGSLVRSVGRSLAATRCVCRLFTCNEAIPRRRTNYRTDVRTRLCRRRASMSLVACLIPRLHEEAKMKQRYSKITCTTCALSLF